MVKHTTTSAVEIDTGELPQSLTERDFQLSLSFFDRKTMTPGFEYYLMPIEVRNHSLSHDLQMAYRRGWRGVERSVHPEWGLPDELSSLVREGEVQHQHNFIVDRGRILLRIPTHMYEAIEKEFAKRNLDNEARLKGGYEMNIDPTNGLLRGPAELRTGAAYMTAPQFRTGNMTNAHRFGL